MYNLQPDNFYTIYKCVFSWMIFFFWTLKSILKKTVTMQPAPSAVYHYSDTGGHSGNVHHNKVNAIFQAAKKDLLKIIQLQAKLCSAWNN